MKADVNESWRRGQPPYSFHHVQHPPNTFFNFSFQLADYERDRKGWRWHGWTWRTAANNKETERKRYSSWFSSNNRVTPSGSILLLHSITTISLVSLTIGDGMKNKNGEGVMSCYLLLEVCLTAIVLFLWHTSSNQEQLMEAAHESINRMQLPFSFFLSACSWYLLDRFGNSCWCLLLSKIWIPNFLSISCPNLGRRRTSLFTVNRLRTVYQPVSFTHPPICPAETVLNRLTHRSEAHISLSFPGFTDFLFLFLFHVGESWKWRRDVKHASMPLAVTCHDIFTSTS